MIHWQAGPGRVEHRLRRSRANAATSGVEGRSPRRLCWAAAAGRLCPGPCLRPPILLVLLFAQAGRLAKLLLADHHAYENWGDCE